MATLPNSASNLIPIKVTQLMDAPVASEDGLILYIYNGNTYKIRVGDLLSVSGVPLTRQVLAGTSMTGGGPLSADVTLSVAPGGIGTTQLASTGVTPGQYGGVTSVPVVTVDATGRVTTISTVTIDTGGVPTTRQVIAGTGLTGGGPLSSDVTLNADLSNTTPLDLLNTGSAGVSTSISRADHQHPAVDLASDAQVDGLLGLDHGGTAKSLVAAAGGIVWSGADGLYIGQPGVAGQALLSDGLNEYNWGTVAAFTVQPAHHAFLGPLSGADADPAFRAIDVTDIPTLNQNTTGTASNVTGTVAIANGGTGQTTKSAAFDALSPLTAQGDLLVGGAAGTGSSVGIGGANTLLHGGTSTPAYSAVVEADISLSANTTNDVTTARHGFCPVLPNNATLFLNGQGNYALPSGLTVSASYSATAFSGQTSVNVVHNFGAYPIVQVVDNTGAVLIPLTTINNTLNDFTVTFNVSTTGTIMASVGSPQPQALISVSSNYTVLNTDRIIKVTAAAAIITLPTSVGNTGREFIINNASTGNVTVATTSSQTISGQLTQLLPSYSSMIVYADGSDYWII
jgi:hypothetical protein